MFMHLDCFPPIRLHSSLKPRAGVDTRSDAHKVRSERVMSPNFEGRRRTQEGPILELFFVL